MSELLYDALVWVLTAALGVVGFFLKKTYDRLDKVEHQQAAFVPRGDYEKLRGEVQDVQRDYIRKDDFFREMAKVDGKLNQIITLFVEKGFSNGK